MELYLDSIKFEEVEEANKLGIIAGLTTTPTFLYKEGITDFDAAIVKLSRMVKILHVEALGDTAEDIVKEAKRLLSLGLDKSKTVFKIPVSEEGVKACKILTDEGMMVNLHLIYTLQQAYMAFSAGATYACVLVGRMQDQGQDALTLVEQCVKAVERFNYPTKIMFSSVRHVEHVRNSLNLGAHVCTIPWKVLKQLPQNHFTDIGIKQFVDHTQLLTIKAGDIARTENIKLNYNATILEALEMMTKSKLGSIIIQDDKGEIFRIFTDGDLRRHIEGGLRDVIHTKLSELKPNTPVTVTSDLTLMELTKIFKENKVDNVIVMENNLPFGIVDIQDIIKWI